MKISGFFCHSDFTWNHVWSFLSPKNSLLIIWAALNFDCWHFQVWFFPPQKNQNSKPAKLLKQQQFLTFKNQPELISRKIRVAEKWLNFNTVEYPLSKIAIRLLRSVKRKKCRNQCTNSPVLYFLTGFQNYVISITAKSCTTTFPIATIISRLS